MLSEIILFVNEFSFVLVKSNSVRLFILSTGAGHHRNKSDTVSYLFSGSVMSSTGSPLSLVGVGVGGGVGI